MQVFYTFTILNDLTNSSGIVSGNGMGYRDFEFGRLDTAYINNNFNFNSRVSYNNNVFFLNPNGGNEYDCLLNKFGENCVYNTIWADRFYSNTIKNHFNSNIIQYGFRI